MSRIRTIKPEFWTSEQVVECSPMARLLFIGIWNFCDDGGVIPAKPLQLKIKVFAGDAFSVNDITGWVDELLEHGLLVAFESQGSQYWRVTGWHHQRIDRPTYRYPQQPESDEHSTNDQRALEEHSTNDQRALDTVREGKGKDLNKPRLKAVAGKANDSIWGDGLRYLLDEGCGKEATLRTLLGRLVKQYGKARVDAAITEMIANGPAEPKAYLLGILKRGKGPPDGVPPTDDRERRIAAALESTPMTRREAEQWVDERDWSAERSRP